MKTKLTATQAAARAGIQPGTWRSYTTPKGSRGGRLHGPAPDGHAQPCGCPWWWDTTVDAWLRNRPRMADVTKQTITAKNLPANQSAIAVGCPHPAPCIDVNCDGFDLYASPVPVLTDPFHSTR